MAHPAAASMTALSFPVVGDPADDSKSKSYRRSRSGNVHQIAMLSFSEAPLFPRINYLGANVFEQAATPVGSEERSVMRPVRLARHARSWD
jgi:hypothetical protein